MPLRRVRDLLGLPSGIHSSDLLRYLLQRRPPAVLRGLGPPEGIHRGKALLLYKTAPLVDPRLTVRYDHTNNWEVRELVRLLGRLGFVVDVLDRSADPQKLHLPDDYDIFIGLGAGNSGQHYAGIAASLPRAVRLLYAAGPDPDESNRLIVKRHKAFTRRHPGHDLRRLRMITKIDVRESIRHTDAVLCIGDDFAAGSFEKHGLPVFRILPSTSPCVQPDPNMMLDPIRRRAFLYFGGNGLLCKGLDLAIEAFAGLDGIELHICGPPEEEFWNFYRPIVEQSANLHFHGFVRIGGPIFKHLIAQCGYVVHPACSEGIATSVATVLRAGLVPIVTPQTGIATGEGGHLIHDISVEGLRALILGISQESDTAWQRRVLLAYEHSFSYTQAAFTRTFTCAVLRCLHMGRKASSTVSAARGQKNRVGDSHAPASR